LWQKVRWRFSASARVIDKIFFVHCMIPSQLSLEWNRLDALPVQMNTVSLSLTV
jgi:hypothetical protein